MSILSRVKSLFNAKVNKALDTVEGNSKFELLRQKLVELKEAHSKSITGLAKTKAIQIKFKKDAKGYQDKADVYRIKADKLKVKFSEATTDESKNELKPLIISVLNTIENMESEASKKNAESIEQGKIVTNLELKIKSVGDLIRKTEADIDNKEARADAAKVNKEISKELSDVNFDGLTSHINKIEKEIDNDNAEAEAWVDLGESLESDEDKINKLLNETSPTSDDTLFSSFMDK